MMGQKSQIACMGAAKVTVEVLIESVVPLRLSSVIRQLEVVGLNPVGC